MTKPKREPVNRGTRQAGDPAKKQPRRQRTGSVGPASGEAQTAYLVPPGDAEEIEAAFERTVPDWESWSKLERQNAVELMQAFWQHPIAPTLTVTKDESGKVRLAPRGNATLEVLRNAETFATTSTELVDERVGDLVNHHSASNRSGATSDNINASLAFIRGGNAQDPVQAALLTQMVATHDAAMRSLAMLGKAEWIDHVGTFGNLSTKLLNAYARQAEALAKLQRGGEQTVRHLYVDARTQTAITCPPIQSNLSEQSHEQDESSTFGTAMLGYDPSWNGVPMPGDEESQQVSAPRRKGRSAEG